MWQQPPSSSLWYDFEPGILGAEGSAHEEDCEEEGGDQREPVEAILTVDKLEKLRSRDDPFAPQMQASSLRHGHGSIFLPAMLLTAPNSPPIPCLHTFAMMPHPSQQTPNPHTPPTGTDLLQFLPVSTNSYIHSQ